MAATTKPPPPSTADLRRQLGRSYQALESFLVTNDELRPEWKYYGPKYGWSLKLFDGPRNICFISASAGYFTIAFVLGARAVEAALSSRLPAAVRQQIRDARVYAEGRGVRIEVKSRRGLAPAQLLLEIKRTN